MAFFNASVSTLQANANILSAKISNKDRKTVLDGLGKAGSNYRETIYNKGFSGEKETLSL
ncbi:hypothetical protein JCM19302_4153 [Jejuia pallidilutea]|nr:hypothetical protein JCM19302_4153 [Jejuia pallidilutea]